VFWVGNIKKFETVAGGKDHVI